MNREDFAVECGPVLSLTSRQKTGELLAGLFPGLEARSVSQALTQKVRVVGGLSQMTAEALTKAIGPQATGAHVVRGRATRRGMGAFFRRGLPFVGVGAGALLGLLWNPLGWAIGGGVAVAGGLFNAGQPIPTLAEAPVGPVLDTALSEAARAFVASRGALDDVSWLALDAVVRRGFEVISWTTDPEDIVAMASGGLHGPLGETVAKMVLQAMGIATKARSEGRARLTEAEREILGRLAALVGRVWDKVHGTDATAEALEEVESYVETEVAAIDEVAHDLYAI